MFVATANYVGGPEEKSEALYQILLAKTTRRAGIPRQIKRTQTLLFVVAISFASTQHVAILSSQTDHHSEVFRGTHE
jgi:hypothetical protein